LLSFGFQGSFVVSPLLLQTIFGLSVTMTSLVSACRTVSVGLAAPFASRFSIRFGERPVVIAAAAATGLGFLGLAFGADSEYLAVVVAGLVVTGFANGHTSPASTAMMANAVDMESFGLANSLQQMANQTGAVLGIGLFSAIAANSAKPGPFAVGFLIAAGVAGLAGLIIMFGIPKLEERNEIPREVLAADTALLLNEP
jgi:MFS family permease